MPDDRSSDPNRQVSADAWARVDTTHKPILAATYRSTVITKRPTAADKIRSVNDAVRQRKFGPLGEPGDPLNEHEILVKSMFHWSHIMAKGTE